MPYIALYPEIEKQHWVFSDWVRGWKWNAIKRTSLQTVARYWLENIFPRHFTPGNDSRYQMEPRNQFYKNVVKKQEGEGQGRFVDLLLKGQSKRWLRSSARITGTPTRATLYMQGPAYFANPYIGKLRKEVVDQKYNARLGVMEEGRRRFIEINIRHQPDKPRELTTISEQDRQDMRRAFNDDLNLRIKLAVAASGSSKLNVTGRMNARLNR